MNPARTVSWPLFAGVVVAAAFGCRDAQPDDAAPSTGVVQVGDLEIFDGYVIEPALNEMAAAYLSIRNFGSVPDTLIGAASPIAGRVLLHTQLIDGPLGHMRGIDRIVIAPGTTVTLVPGGYHLMMTDLRTLLAAGDSVTLDLSFRRAGTVEVRLPVVPPLELVRGAPPPVSAGRHPSRASPA